MSISEGCLDTNSCQSQVNEINRAYNKRGVTALAAAVGLSSVLSIAYGLGLRVFSSDPSALSSHVYQEALLAEETLSLLETKKESSTRPLFSYEPKGLASLLDTAFRNNDGKKVSLDSAVDFMQQRVSSLHNSSAYKEYIAHGENRKENLILDASLCAASILALHVGAIVYIISNNKRRKAELSSLSSVRGSRHRSSTQHQG